MDTHDVHLSQMLPIMRNLVLSFFNLRLSFKIHKQMSDMQLSMLFEVESWSDLRLGLNDM